MINLLRALIIAAILHAAPASAQFVAQQTYGATGSGSANAQTFTIGNLIAYLPGVPLTFVPGFSNTGATTLNVNGIGVIAVRRPSPAGLVALTGGEFQAGVPVTVMYDGTFMDIMYPSAGITIDGGIGAYTVAGGLSSSGKVIQPLFNSATLQATPSTATSSTSNSMMGLGATCRITPVNSGRIRVSFTGSVGGNGTTANNSQQLRYGTGTAPINGASPIGTTVGGLVTVGNGGGGQTAPLAMDGIITGLSLGVSVWLDLSSQAGAGGATIVASCTANEF